jgi:hypothetical protein
MLIALAGLLAACSSGASPSATPATEPPPTFIPTATADVTPTPSLVVTPPPAPTPERTPPATPAAATPEPALDVEVTVPTWWLHRGDRVSVTARTRPGVPCTLSLQWVDSGASGPFPTEPATIGTRSANAEGIVRWRWTVDPARAPFDGWVNDEAWVTVTCREGDVSGDGSTAFWVVPSGFVPSATLPPELLGTWVLEWAKQGPGQIGCSPPEPCPSVTFILGSCALGERCGSLIQANKPGCRFPLVFYRNSAPGVFTLNAGEDDTAGCDEGWGTGLHFVPTAEGTVRLSTRDGTNVILRRVDTGPVPATPQTLLARVWSTDESGTQHDVARLEDTNCDGLPSVGDTLRLGQFPYFSTDGSLAYGDFTVTTHTVTGTRLLKYPDHVGLSLSSEGRNWAIVQFDPTAELGGYDETYTEWDTTTADTSFFIDSTPPSGVKASDYTLVTSGSPGHPAPNAGWAAGPASTNLIDIEFLWAY